MSSRLFRRHRNGRRGALLMVVVAFLLPMSMFLFASVLNRIEAVTRQTRWEEERLRAEMMAASAVAWVSAAEKGGGLVPAVGEAFRHEFGDRQAFEVERGDPAEGNRTLICRGMVHVDHPIAGEGTLVETIVLEAEGVGSWDSGRSMAWRIVERRREYVRAGGEAGV